MNYRLLSISVFFCLTIAAVASPRIDLVRVFAEQSLTQPLFLTHAGDSSGRVFVLEQGGRILMFEEGASEGSLYLDLSSKVTNQSEMGLLGLAFHPRFEENGRLFVSYTTEVGGPRRSILAEFSVDPPDTGQADPTSEEVLLSVQQPARNHNGGMIAFDQNGFLYLALGDGGGANDQFGNGQNLLTLLGTILRIDIDRGDPYSIPPDNPFADVDNAQPEIWAYGLRNPWRFSFDRFTGQLYAADVGQSAWEEIDLITKGGNYGWNIMEGGHCFQSADCDQEGLILPIGEYSHDFGDSITGGYVYRGPDETSLWGSYLFGDFGSGRIWALSLQPGGRWEQRLISNSELAISSFGEDEAGNLYVVDYGGGVFRVEFGEVLRFSQVADGETAEGSFQSGIVLINPSDGTRSGVIRVFDEDGDAGSVPTSEGPLQELPFELVAGETREIRTLGSSDPLFVGWAEVEGDGPLSASILFSLESPEGALITEAGIAASELSTTAASHVVSRGTGLGTGLAIANPGDLAVQVTLELYQGGVLFAEQPSFLLGARSQTARFISEFFQLEDDFEGTLRLTATGPVAVTLLRTQNGLVISSLPLGN